MNSNKNSGFKRGSFEYVEIKAHVSWGANSKINEDSMVFNAGDSIHCVSQALGLCQIGTGGCFMQKCEKRYPALAPYHSRQGTLWSKYNAEKFAYTLLNIANDARTKEFTEFRYGESGDFKNQKQLDWFDNVCAILTLAGVVCYGYTARTDLNLYGLIKSSQVNLSNDDYNSIAFQNAGANRFKAVLEYSGDNPICPCPAIEAMNKVNRKKIGKSYKKIHPCGTCNLCKTHTGIIEEIIT